MYTKITKQNVVDLISNGWSRDLIACGSNQNPSDESAYLFNSNDFHTREHFVVWHEKHKKRVCNEINGKSLRYYIVVKDGTKQESSFISKKEYNKIKKRESRARLKLK